MRHVTSYLDTAKLHNLRFPHKFSETFRRSDYRQCIALVIDFDETIGTDGISLQPSVTSNGSESYYTLQGQKVERPTTKGIYIYKGKKIMVK